MAEIGTDIRKACYWLEQGEVVAIPTETVYGLAANIYNQTAVEKIYSVKGRPKSNPLIVHVADRQKAEELVLDFQETARQLADMCWPGPLTMVFRKSPLVPDRITAGQETVAIRVPDHALTLALLQLTGFPIAAPSANPFNYISPVTADQVNEMLGDKIPYILEGGRCAKGIESTILGFTKPGEVQLLRPGALNVTTVEEAISTKLTGKNSGSPSHPGMFKVHYSPRTPLFLFTSGTALDYFRSGKSVACLFYKEKQAGMAGAFQEVLSTRGDPEEAAWNLYNMLYRLDQGGFDYIMAELLPETGLGLAVNDRLRKAAQPYGGE